LESFQTTIDYSARVLRVALPKRQSDDLPFVIVDVWIPEEKRGGIPVLDPKWIEPGVYRTMALIKKNRRTLAPFLASGLQEIDLREEAA
jgi:hypothetical protein